MFFYPTWLQTTPPLFLLVVRTVIQIFGLSNYTLRAVPFALHLTTVLIMAVFARRAFAPSLALLCVTLVAISPSGIRYAEELKQYAGDEAVSALLILLLWLLVEGERRALSMLLIALPIVVFFSHTSVFFLPLITGTVLFTRRALPLRTRLIQAGLLSFAGIALSIANYWLFVRPNLSSHLIEYWEFGFPHSHSWKASLSFYVEYMAGVPVYFFLTTPMKDGLKSFFHAARAWQLALLITPGLASGVLVLFKLLKRPKQLYLVATFVLPLLTLLLLNAFRLYPVSARRLLLFMLPPVAVAITIAAEVLWESIRSVWPSKTRRVSIVSIPFGALLVAALLSVNPRVWSLPEGEDIEAAVRNLASNVKPDDVVFVQGSVSEGEILYARMLRWRHERTIQGETASACCPRNPRFSVENSDPHSIQAEADRAVVSAGNRTLWFLSTNNAEHWEYLGLDAKALQVQRIESDGCVLLEETAFWNMYVAKFHCGGNSES